MCFLRAPELMTTSFREMMLFSQGLRGRSHSSSAPQWHGERVRGLLSWGCGGQGCHFLPFTEPCACICCPRQNTRADAQGSLTEKSPDPESWLSFLAVHFSALCWGRALKE